MNTHATNVALIFFLWLLALMGGACQTTSPEVQPAASTQPPAAASAEGDLQIASSPLTSPLEPPQPVETPLPTPTLPQPASGKAALSGVIYSSTRQTPIPGTLFYLTPALGEQADQLPPLLAGPQGEQDIGGKTDEQGGFAVNNIPPGNYYMLIWAPLDWVVLADPSGGDDTMPILLELEADQTLDLGVMNTPWP